MKNQLFTALVDGDTSYKIELNTPSSGSVNGTPFSCDLQEGTKNRFHILRDNKSYEIEILEPNLQEKTMVVAVNGKSYKVELSDRYDDLLKSLGMDKANSAKVNELKAPMPGLVLDIRVTEGQSVAKGDPIVVLEAMKMENILKAPVDVVVKKIAVKKGTAVEKNQLLVSFE